MHNEFRLFLTRQRAPFLMMFETISPEESLAREPAFEKDLDYLRCKFNILTPDKLLSDVKEDIKSAKTRENLNFQDLKNYLAKEKDLLDKSMVEVKFVQKTSKRRPVRSKSAGLAQRRRQQRTKNSDFMNVMKLKKMSETEVRNRIAFILQLLKSSKSKGLVKLNIEYLEKLKEVLAMMILKKQRQEAVLKNTTVSDFVSRNRQIREDSPYGKFDSYCLRAFIVKSGDDMRQEHLLIHFINVMRDVFQRENINVFLADLDFVLLSKSSAMIEFVPDSSSVSTLKKNFHAKNLASIYRLLFSNSFHEAQKNFVESLVGYSLFCYLFQVKDRHNANILVDSVGHLVHIDFGFCLGNTPGNMSFETAPFKFTQEYLDVMGGREDYLFYYFRTLMFKSFEVLKKYADQICALVESMKSAELPCFYKFDIKVFESRFHRFLLDQERWDLVDRLINDSLFSRRTTLYDQFQKYSNDIEF